MTFRIGRLVALALAGCIALTGCGKSLVRHASEEGSGPLAAVGAAGAQGLSTKNTTRVGGATPAVDAAAVARTVYPGLSPTSRPQAVVLVSEREWPAALAAAALAGAPLKAPLLYSDGIVLPQVSAQALESLSPTGAGALEGAQAIRIGQAAAPPELRLRQLSGREPAQLAVAVERLMSELTGRRPRRLIIAAWDAPPAMTAPAAGLAAQTATPILFVERTGIPPATRAELARLGRVSMYVVGPSSTLSDAVLSRLRRYGRVTRIAGNDPAANAIAVARFTDGSFGWGVQEPGHGLVLADAARPLDAPAAAPLSANGDYGPLLLVEGPDRIPAGLAGYLSDLQPGSPPSGPVRGVYNHGWLIGDGQAISAATQVRLDAMLEISPRVSGPEPALSAPSTANEATEPNEPSERSEP